MSAKPERAVAVLEREDWQFLEARPGKRELYLKGRRIAAGVLYSCMVANNMTAEEVAADYKLPAEIMHEVIRYCQTHWDDIAHDIDKARASAIAHGIPLDPPAAH